jgi:hypothetical protein
MKWITFLFALLLLGYCQQGLCQQEKQLSADETAQIKSDIIERSEKHAQGLVNLDHKAVMIFYGNVDDVILFGEGNYWGDYITVDQIWQDFTRDIKKMMKWDLKNHKIHVFSRDAASYLVEFDNERIGGNGDTTKVTGCFSYGMRKIDGDWKAVTIHVPRNYKEGYGAGGDKNWWKQYSPERRKNKQ